MFPRPSQTAIATCVKRESLFLVAFSVGNWDKNLLRLLFNKVEDYVQQPSYKHKLILYSDGNDDYTSVLLEYYHKDCLCYGQKIKTKDGKKVFPPIKKIVYGDMNPDDIETNTVESINSVLREKISRLCRKTKKISKNKYSLDSSLWLFKFAWNFIHKRHEHFLTPAMIEGISHKRWTWGMFLHAKLTDVS